MTHSVPKKFVYQLRAHVGLREGGSAAQLRRLRAGRVDVAVIAVGAGLDYELDGLVPDLLTRGVPLLAVADSHPFAGRSWVSVGDLHGQRWIVGDADDSGPQFGPWPTLEDDPTIAHRCSPSPARTGPRPSRRSSTRYAP